MFYFTQVILLHMSFMMETSGASMMVIPQQSPILAVSASASCSCTKKLIERHCTLDLVHMEVTYTLRIQMTLIFCLQYETLIKK